MKRIIAITALVTMILFGGCKKFLTEKPLSQITLREFYKSKFDVDAGIAGMYSAFQLEMVGTKQYAEKYLYWGEYRADNFDRFVIYTKDYVDEIVLNSLTPTNQFSDWTGLYAVIGRANNNIKYVPEAAKLDPKITKPLLNGYMAESYAMRAMSYFYLVRVWGDAPIRLEPYEDIKVPSEVDRSPKEKVMTEVIIPDLERAYDLFATGTAPSSGIFGMGRAAVCATLADVYMWRKDYPNAIKWIKNLFLAKGITADPTAANLEATATWKTMFTNPVNSKEAIWSIHWDYQKNGCACMQTSWTDNNKQIVVDEDIWDKWFQPQFSAATRTTDIRPQQTADVFFAQPRANRDRFIKWYATAANPTAADKWPNSRQQEPVYLTMYRMGDMLLLYAEALNGNNDMVNALKYLNMVRTRAMAPAYLPTDPLVADKIAMENAILNERQLELFGEGKRWFDLVRTDHVKEVMDPVLKRRQLDAGNLDAPGFLDPATKSYWPVNRNVLNSNSKLKQNPGYTD
ncbi:RagB/SusD family nutrient uptake outer membrane protein [Pedobacter nyackensis]|uniref:RagB/SusD family nutrient uptake outer membrane protein n=1 Tax=Pedobacter nyackensis TaxID=475255 RepID=UPI002930CA5B|nr:RagB/SusD family nutrient uptake outer membrane protein [Pedobacter nyackensis]